MVAEKLQEAIETTTETIDGIVYTIDKETGEILKADAPKFAVTDDSTAEWVLKRIADQDAEIAALNAREQALLENLRTMKSRAEQRRAGLYFRFENELAEYARHNLPTGKKSWVCPYGKVQFRTSPARLKVADNERALAYALTGAPDAIKVTHEFQISKLPDDARAGLMELAPDELATRGFEITPEAETVKIETGVSR